MEIEASDKLLKKSFFIALSIAVLAVFAAALASVWLGKDFNWDLRNYHYYNPFAFANDRLAQDVAPAQLQSYHNPLPDLLFYWLTENFHSRIVGIVMALIHGLNIPLVFLISWQVLTPWQTRWRAPVSLALAGLGAYAPGFIAAIGTTFNDNLVSLFVLGALLLALTADHLATRSTFRHTGAVFVSGLIMGMGVGLKPTAAIFAISLAPALLMLFESIQTRIVALFLYGVGGAIGVAATGGWWMWELWQEFANPLFPYFNNIFLSPYSTTHALKVSPFGPRDWLEALSWPVLFSLDAYRVSELQFSGSRFAVVYATALALLGKLILSMFRGPTNSTGHRRLTIFAHGNALLLFFITAFLLWTTISSIYRYLVVLELLAPLVLFVLLDRFFSSTDKKMIVGGFLAIAIAVSVKPANWGRQSWTEEYFKFDIASHDLPANATIMMLGYAPMAYVIPSFSPSITFLRPEMNLHLKEEHLLYVRIKEKLNKRSGPVYFLFRQTDKRVAPQRTARKWGFHYDPRRCKQLVGNVADNLLLCKVAE